MRKQMMVVALLCVGTVQAEKDARYVNLAALDDGRFICYAADVSVNGRVSDVLEKKGNDRLKLLFQGLGLRAAHMDDAASCEHFVAVALEIDNATPPGLYAGGLDVYTTGATTDWNELSLPSIYRHSFWGARGSVYTATQLDAVMDKVLTEAFADFKKGMAEVRSQR